MFVVHHNYLPHVNIENGRIKKDWPDEYIFVNKIDDNKNIEKYI